MLSFSELEMAEIWITLLHDLNEAEATREFNWNAFPVPRSQPPPAGSHAFCQD